MEGVHTVSKASLHGMHVFVVVSRMMACVPKVHVLLHANARYCLIFQFRSLRVLNSASHML